MSEESVPVPEEITFPWEQFVEDTRASISALAQGHNDIKDVLEDVHEIHSNLTETVREQLATSKVLLHIIEQQGRRIDELEAYQRHNRRLHR